MVIPVKGKTYYRVNIVGTKDYQCSYGPFFGTFEELKQNCIKQNRNKEKQIKLCQTIVELSDIMSDAFVLYNITEEIGK